MVYPWGTQTYRNCSNRHVEGLRKDEKTESSIPKVKRKKCSYDVLGTERPGGHWWLFLLLRHKLTTLLCFQILLGRGSDRPWWDVCLCSTMAGALLEWHEVRSDSVAGAWNHLQAHRLNVSVARAGVMGDQDSYSHWLHVASPWGLAWLPHSMVVQGKQTFTWCSGPQAVCFQGAQQEQHLFWPRLGVHHILWVPSES